MATKSKVGFFLCIVLFTGLLRAQGTEEQRKYVVNDTAAFRAFVLASDTIGGFGMRFHSEYTYSDIYLDTPDRWLYQNGFSLRFRRRMDHDTLVGYGLQLKSEMETAQSARMEIEDNELEVFAVRTATGWKPLTEVLKVLFTAIDSGEINTNNADYLEAKLQLQQWIRFKAEGVVAPFRQLGKEMQSRNLDAKAVATLEPVCGGTEHRLRCHIYIDPQQTSPALSHVTSYRRSLSDLPIWFSEHPELIWTMESSLDDAVFYALSGKNAGKEVHIFEYELENKYPVRSEGTPLINQFEAALKKHFSLTSHLDSKYRTCVEAFGL